MHVVKDATWNYIRISFTPTLNWGLRGPGCLEKDQGGSATPGKLKATFWHQGAFALCFGLFYDRQSQAMICWWLNTIWLFWLFINTSFQSIGHTNIGKLGGRGTMVAMETMGNHSNSDPYISKHWYWQGCGTWVVRHKSDEYFLYYSHKPSRFWVKLKIHGLLKWTGGSPLSSLMPYIDKS